MAEWIKFEKEKINQMQASTFDGELKVHKRYLLYLTMPGEEYGLPYICELINFNGARHFVILEDSTKIQTLSHEGLDFVTHYMCIDTPINADPINTDKRVK